MKNIEQLITFKIAAEQGNFSKAALKLGITPAAIGKQIKALEKTIDAQLFYRTTRRVTLTELGEALYEQCEKLLKEAERTKDLIASHKGLPIGKLKIISSIHFGETYLVPHLTEFMTLYPKINIELELADRIPNLESENIDLAFGLMSGLPPHYIQRRLIEVRYVFCASKNYLKKHGSPQTPRDLEKHLYITHSKRPNPTLIIFDKNLKIPINPYLSTNSTSVMIQSCKEGLGIAMLHYNAVKIDIENGKLIEILKKYQQPKQPLYLYFRKLQYMQPKMRVFIDFVLDKINKL